MTVKHSADVSSQPVRAGSQTRLQILQEGPGFIMRRFTIGTGGGMPRHTNTVEHEQYVLLGRARIGIDDREFEVRAGDVVFIPEGVPHWYQNLGQEDFEFLCIIPNREDRITLLEKDSC